MRGGRTFPQKTFSQPIPENSLQFLKLFVAAEPKKKNQKNVFYSLSEHFEEWVGKIAHKLEG